MQVYFRFDKKTLDLTALASSIESRCKSQGYGGHIHFRNHENE